MTITLTSAHLNCAYVALGTLAYIGIGRQVWIRLCRYYAKQMDKYGDDQVYGDYIETSIVNSIFWPITLAHVFYKKYLQQFNVPIRPLGHLKSATKTRINDEYCSMIRKKLKIPDDRKDNSSIKPNGQYKSISSSLFLINTPYPYFYGGESPDSSSLFLINNPYPYFYGGESPDYAQDEILKVEDTQQLIQIESIIKNGKHYYYRYKYLCRHPQSVEKPQDA